MKKSIIIVVPLFFSLNTLIFPLWFSIISFDIFIPIPVEELSISPLDVENRINKLFSLSLEIPLPVSDIVNLIQSGKSSAFIFIVPFLVCSAAFFIMFDKASFSHFSS